MIRFTASQPLDRARGTNGGNSQHVGRAGPEPSPPHRGARQGAGARSFTADLGPDSCRGEPHGGSEDRPHRGSDSERLNLSTLDRREQLLPFLQSISSSAERQYIAGKIFEGIRSGPDSVSHVGEIGQIRVPIHDVLRTHGLTELQARAHQVQSARPGAETILLLNSTDVARLKPFFVVRDKSQFRNQLILWSVLFFCSFWAVHIFWSVRGIGGPQYVLPSVLLLSGVGLTLMITLRDPLRDTLAFSTFAQGVAAGCVVLALASTLDYRRISGKLSYVFLIASFLLSAGLILFGSGPTGSDAKVNLLGFQPAEVIRVLIVFFLAGYFAERWEFLRTLRDQRKGLEKISRWVEVPRLEYLLPVVGGVIVSLAFFFLQKDLGPALLIACLFLAMYAVARDRYLFALHGPGRDPLRVCVWLLPRLSEECGWPSLDVAITLGQLCSRGRTGGAFALGVRHGWGLRHGPRTGRSAVDARGSYRSHPRCAWRGMGIPGRTRSACTLCRPGLVWHSRRAPCTLRLQLLPRARTHPGLRSPDRTDCGRRARFNPSLRRRGSLPQLRQNRSHH